jgi:hypothetical protein
MCMTAYDYGPAYAGTYYNFIFPCPNASIARNQVWSVPAWGNPGP